MSSQGLCPSGSFSSTCRKGLQAAWLEAKSYRILSSSITFETIKSWKKWGTPWESLCEHGTKSTSPRRQKIHQVKYTFALDGALGSGVDCQRMEVTIASTGVVPLPARLSWRFQVLSSLPPQPFFAFLSIYSLPWVLCIVQKEGRSDPDYGQ